MYVNSIKWNDKFKRIKNRFEINKINVNYITIIQAVYVNLYIVMLN